MLYLIPNMKDIREILKLSEQYDAAFEYNEFAMPDVLGDADRTKELISFYKLLGRDTSCDTMHGAFLDITVHSEDPDIRSASRHRVYQCMDIADRLGLKAVIFHTNTIPNFRSRPYLDNWLKLNEEFYREVTDRYPHIAVFMENMFDELPDDLAAIAERMQDVENFGVCFDYAHANVFGRSVPLKVWAETLLPYTRHIHVNDNDGHIDQHAAVGKGGIDWEEYDTLIGGYVRSCDKMAKHAPAPSVLIETNSLDNIEQSCIYMSEHGVYPFN